MIRFNLKCDQDHQFESWFASNAAFESLQATGMLNCAICGSAKVAKSLMAPSVQHTDAPLSQPATDTEAKLKQIAAVRNHVDQFFSGDTNRRSDEWGGDTLPERTRFATEILKRTRAEIGESVPIIIRVSPGKSAPRDAKTRTMSGSTKTSSATTTATDTKIRIAG